MTHVIDLGHRFWSKVDSPGGHLDSCWTWTAAATTHGYGQFAIKRLDGTWATAYAHRLAYESIVGTIPGGYHLDHLCRTPPCVNPWHLEPVPPRINLERGLSPRLMVGGRCKNGHHIRSSDDIYVRPSGSRLCRECNRVQTRKWAAMHPVRGGSRAARPKSMRIKAMAMLAGGSTARDVAIALGVHPATVYRWAKADRSRHSIGNDQ